MRGERGRGENGKTVVLTQPSIYEEKDRSKSQRESKTIEKALTEWSRCLFTFVIKYLKRIESEREHTKNEREAFGEACQCTAPTLAQPFRRYAQVFVPNCQCSGMCESQPSLFRSIWHMLSRCRDYGSLVYVCHVAHAQTELRAVPYWFVHVFVRLLLLLRVCLRRSSATCVVYNGYCVWVHECNIHTICPFGATYAYMQSQSRRQLFMVRRKNRLGRFDGE